MSIALCIGDYSKSLRQRAGTRATSITLSRLVCKGQAANIVLKTAVLCDLVALGLALGVVF